MKKLNLAAVLVSSLALVCLLGGKAQAQTCSLSSLNTTYGFASQSLMRAYVSPSAGGGYQPRAAGGLVAFDGAGNLSGVVFVKIGTGSVIPLSVAGTYTVATTCEGTITYTASNGYTLNGTLFVAANSAEVVIMQTDPGSTWNITAKPTAAASCTAASAHGTFGYSASGLVKKWTAGSLLGYTPLLLGGWVFYDGGGNLNGADTVSWGGSIVSRTFAGTYTMHSNCSGLVTLTDSLGQTSTGAIILVDGGKEIDLLNFDTPNILTITANK